MGKEFEITYVFTLFQKLLSALGTTMFIVVASILLGIVVGFFIALPRLYQIPVLRHFSQVFVSFFRGTPVLIQLFLIYYGLPEVLKLFSLDVSKAPVLLFVIFTYALHSGAFISEAIRSAVTAVDRGQVEAAYAIGMNGYQAFTRIVLPQALAISIPVLANIVIANLKDTSLAFSLGVIELTGKAQTLVTATQHFIETYIALAGIYLLISVGLEKVFNKMERRLLSHEKRVTPESMERGSSKLITSYKGFVTRLKLGKGGSGV
ncbi:L-cystine transport system permease protein TcyL [Brevibacillus reuszeri]|uniref:Cysteine ABC transporter permease n=1 Tax=Brevibacillus reuszeri TaxID=54915 RepID=A0A0K9YWA5_9BACL|nr:amino acid ABC transporter permease [Brevibacillus reuszeri]KNB72902.1 cysteine ABC transporter permease [Brevibacillus reuszeri]MED1861734.1 amino acid ABC transporter permease [Brevibacillus reuszeri]GED72746.1 L-cystine transport system permease protein TcyL [Brevibacillus reuszeri]